MSFDTKRNLNIKYEDMKNDHTYSITLNPENAYQFWDLPDRIETFKKHHINNLKKSSLKDRINIFVLDIRLEFSPAGRLHFHGYIKILNKLKFYEYTLNKLTEQYQYEIDTIADHEVWETYINKQELDSKIQIGNDFKLMTKDFYTINNGNQENL